MRFQIRNEKRNRRIVRMIITIGMVSIAVVMMAACSRSVPNRSVSESLTTESEEKETSEKLASRRAEERKGEARSNIEKETTTADDISDRLTKEQYIASCKRYVYQDLMNRSNEYDGELILVTIKVVKIIDDQYLGVSEDGDTYVIFDDRNNDPERVFMDDTISVYGIFEGIENVSGTNVPTISARYIQIFAESPVEELPTQVTPTVPLATEPTYEYKTMYVINCNKSITLRTNPSTSASGIRQIPLGAAVSFIEAAENGFYKVIYLSDTGYALAAYLGDEPKSSTTESSFTTEPYSYYQTLYVVNCNKSITLRTSPSTSAAAIRQIPLGASVTYLEDASNGFLKVVYLSDTGYALASYLSSSKY